MATSIPTAKSSAHNRANTLSSGRTIYRIIGIACLAGFILDILVLASPPDPLALEWRIGFLQQVGDRSIVFMFGVAFLLVGTLDMGGVFKKVAKPSMIIGLIFCLMVPLSIRDSIVLQKQVSGRIDSQASQIETQIQTIQADPELKDKPSSEQIEQALASLNERSDALRKNAIQTSIRTGAASAGNLLVTGLALIGLGRYGMRR